MENKLTPDQRLLLLGKVWGIASQISESCCFWGKMDKEELIELLEGDNWEYTLKRIQTMNDGYRNITECFYMIIPDGEEND